MLHKIRAWFNGDLDRWAWIVFAIMAILYTSPYWLDCKLWIGSSDNHYHFVPNTLFTLLSLKKGSLGLWNPYILTGIDFTTSSHNYISNPLMWPLFFFSGDGFLEALNFKVGLDYFLIGLCSYWFLKAEVRDKKWAFLGALTYQISGISLFAFTTYPYAQLLWLIPLTLYWVWTSRARSSLSFVFGLTVLFTVITLTMNITYIVGTYFAFMVLFIKYLLGLDRSERRRFFWLTVTALGVMALLTAWRWVPIAESLFLRGSRLASATLLPTSGNIYYLSRALIGEVFGINLTEGLPLLPALGMTGHAQFHAPPYLGVIPVLLALFAMFFASGMRFWTIYLVISVVWFLELTPIAFLIEFMVLPFVHSIVPKISIPIPFAVLVAYGGIWLEGFLAQAQVRSLRPQLKLLFWVWVPITLMGLMVWTYSRPEVYGMVKLAWMGIALFAYLVLFKLPDRLAIALVTLFSLLAALSPVRTVIRRHLLTEHYILSVLTFSAIPMFFVALVWMGLTLLKHHPRYLKWFCWTLCTLMCAVCLVRIPIIRVDQSLTEHVFKIGAIRFTLLLITLGLILRQVAAKKIPLPSLAILLITLTVIDLVPASKNFSRQIWDFYQVRPMYPRPFGLEPEFSANRAVKPMDTANFRLSWPHGLLDIPWVEATNTAMIYGVHMYSGLNSDVPRRLSTLVRHFEPTEPASSGIEGVANNERLGDILGVRYTLDKDKKFLERPNAVPRFAFFENFEFTPSEGMLEEVSRPEWRPSHSLLVFDPQKEVAPRPATNSGLKMLEYRSSVGEKIALEFEATQTGYLLFNDGYDPSWTVTVNGKPKAIHVANHNFMAVAIKDLGVQKIEFEFRPVLFLKSVRISLMALVLFLGIWCGLYWRQRRARAPMIT